MANKTVYLKSGLTGGGAGTLDGISGEGLLSADVAFTLSSDNASFVHEATTSATAENSPFNIVPDSCAASFSWRWQTDPMLSFRESLSATGGTISNYGVSHIVCGLSNAYTLTLTAPVLNAYKTITIAGGTSHTVRIKNASSGVHFGAAGTSGPHIFMSDSNPRIANPMGLGITLHSTGTTRWRILQMRSTGKVTLSTDISS